MNDIDEFLLSDSDKLPDLVSNEQNQTNGNFKQGFENKVKHA
jgi:hypothetical protein